MLRFSVLGSGSAGNSAVVTSGRTTVLVDAGLSARQLCLRLESVGLNPDELDAIVLTHEHGDHVSGLDVFCRKREIPIFATSHTARLVREGMRCEGRWKVFEAGGSFEIGDLHIESFPVPHDAVDPVGFVLRNGRGALGVLSDVGHVTALARERLRGVDTLFVEANYDEVLLQNDTRRPWSTKQRIASRHGHLSNAQAAELVAELATEPLQRVVLGHLSRDCNRSDVAEAAIREGLKEGAQARVEVTCARQREPLPLVAVAADSPEAEASPVSATPTSQAGREQEEPEDYSRDLPGLWAC